MSTPTANIGFLKPFLEEMGWDEIISGNWDILDTVLASHFDAYIQGSATAGTATKLYDEALSMDIDSMAGGTIIVRRGTSPIRISTIISNTVSTFFIASGAAIQLGDTYIAIPDTQTGITDLNNKTHDFISYDLGSASAVQTLSAAENKVGQYRCINTLTINKTVVVSNDKRWITVDNRTTGAFTLTFKTSTGLGVVIPQGTSKKLYCDGVDVIVVSSESELSNVIALGSTISNTLTDGVWANLSLNSILYNGANAAVALGYQVIVPSWARWCEVQCGFRLSSISSGEVISQVLKNGITKFGFQSLQRHNSSPRTTANSFFSGQVSGGDKMSIQGYQSTGASQTSVDTYAVFKFSR